MKESELIIRDGKRQTDWLTLGAEIADANEDGIALFDLHAGNFGDYENRIVIVDYGGREKIDFPKHWELLPTCLFSLFDWLSPSYAGAFRFGYLHHLGPIGSLIFDQLRTEFGINSFTGFPEISYEPRTVTPDLKPGEEAAAIHKSWVKLRDAFPAGDLSECSHLYRVGKAHLDLEVLSEVRRTNSPMTGYLYEKQLAVSVATNNSSDITLALANLARMYSDREDWRRSCAVSTFAALLLRSSNEASAETSRIVDEALEKSYKMISQGDKLELSQIPLYGNVFHFLWSLDDLCVGTAQLQEGARLNRVATPFKE